MSRFLGAAQTQQRHSVTIGVDPGQKSPAHVRIETLEHDVTPLRATDEDVYVEDQYPNPKSSRQSLITLGRAAGSALGAYKIRGCRVYLLKPEKWREILAPLVGFRGSARNANKVVFQNYARRAGVIPDPIWDLGLDAVDAYLIGLAGLHSKTKLKEWTW